MENTILNYEWNEVNSVLDAFLNSHRNQDIELLSKIFSHDTEMINFGSDEDEIFTGWEELRESFLKQFRSFEKTEVNSRDRKTKFSKDLNVCWYSEILDFRIIIDAKPIFLEGFRHTGTMEKIDGNWIIVQFHYSVPVKGQAVQY